MKYPILYLVVISMVLGCAGVTKSAKPSDAAPAPKKFDPGELYFKWVIMLPLEVLVGIPSGALFMTSEEVERKSIGWDRQIKQNEEKRSKSKGWLKY